MTNALQTRFDAELNRHYEACRALATERLQAFVKFWQRTFPKKKLEFLFGNGGWYIEIDGKGFHPHLDGAPKYWRDFEDDMNELTLQGKLSLDDLTVEPTGK